MSYDYIIVGAGSAGCVVAARLTEDPSIKVLLLEAGGRDRHIFTRMPMGFLKAMLQPHLTWGYKSEPEPHLDNRVLNVPRGRVLGGSSTINGLFYMRGHPLDYDTWRQMGCTGWSYADVLPYFRRMERSSHGDTEYRGGQGPLDVRPIDTRKLLHEPLMASAAAAGYGTSDDINGAVAEGFSRGEVNIDRRGRRASSARAYLYPALSRPNLTLVSDALTTRVILENGRAKGIEYVRDGTVEQAFAEREVVLSGGAYNSPQLLMLSGIGPADGLSQHGIEVALDLPGVGRNLSEHPYAALQFAAAKPVTFLNELRLDRAVRSVAEWALFGSGPFATQINSCNIVIRTGPELAQPDIQIMCNPIRMDAALWFPGLTKRQAHVFSVGVCLLHPHSRGHLELRSADPNDKPRIFLNMFAERADFETMRRGIRAARQIYQTEPQVGLTGSELVPGADVESDAALDAFIRRTAGGTQHPVGTCMMGTGPMSVVDPELRVHGIEGLRVIDASIMPTVPGANTNASAIMIGEKGADLLRGQALPPSQIKRDAA